MIGYGHSLLYYLDAFANVIFLEMYDIFVAHCIQIYIVIPFGLVVRIPGFHPGGPGSIPGMGSFFICDFCVIKQITNRLLKIPYLTKFWHDRTLVNHSFLS